MANKSAKDLAFDKERAKYRRQIRELEYELELKNQATKMYIDQIHDLEQKNGELHEQMKRLLQYTELSEEDMKKLLEKEKNTAEVMEYMNSMIGLCGNLRRGCL